jgi:hypothetical protein
MDKATAWKVIQTGFRCGAELQDLLHILKGQCSTQDFKEFAVAIATAVDTINVQLIDRALKAYPELREKIESDLARNGRIS